MQNATTVNPSRAMCLQRSETARNCGAHQAQRLNHTKQFRKPGAVHRCFPGFISRGGRAVRVAPARGLLPTMVECQKPVHTSGACRELLYQLLSCLVSLLILSGSAFSQDQEKEQPRGEYWVDWIEFLQDSVHQQPVHNAIKRLVNGFALTSLCSETIPP